MITWRRILLRKAWQVFSVGVAVCTAAAWAAGTAAPTVAVAVTAGQVEINQVKAEGGANVPEGAVLRTREAAARLQFRNGARATLGSDSQATVFAGRLVLQAGSGLVGGTTAVGLEALGFRVNPQTASSSALVEHKGRFIQVSAIAGSVAVFDLDGEQIARVEMGKPLTFEPAGLVRLAPDDPSQGKEQNKKQGLSRKAKVGVGVGVAAGVGLGVGLPLAVLSR